MISFDEFLKLGKDLPESEFQKRVQAVTPQDLAGIVYTFGTTGVPKGRGFDARQHHVHRAVGAALHRCPGRR